MKKIIALSLVVFSLNSLNKTTAQTNVFPTTGSAGIGTMASQASSLLDMQSTTKGLLIPRMTKTQRDVIVSPATGLMIYQTNSTPGFYYYDGTAWTAVSSAKGVNKSLSNLTGPTAINAGLLPGTANSIDLGSAAKSWKDIYFNGSLFYGSRRAFAIDTSNGNMAIGENTLFSNSTGQKNAAIGYQALYSNTEGSYNNANGYQALYSNTEGSYNSASGYQALYQNVWGISNTANGYQALFSNIQGSNNTATGAYTLMANTEGTNNTATGGGALSNNTTGYNNVANGSYALNYNTTGSSNIAIGSAALSANTTGYGNIAIGEKALLNNKIASNLVAIGDSALYNNGTGYGNVAIGSKSLFSNTTGYFNTANGASALYLNTTGYSNTADGHQALLRNTTGYSNTAVGDRVLYYNTTGSSNTASGYGALYTNTTGSNNVAIGAGSLYLNNTKSNLVAIGDSALYYNGYEAVNASEAAANVAIGSKSLHYNTKGSENIATGSKALHYNITGSYNTANGHMALFTNQSGMYNTASGHMALYTNVAGSNNVAIGRAADVTSGGLNNAMALGAFAQVNASNKVVIGNSSVTVIGGQVGWSTFSDGRFKSNIKQNVPGLEFINKLNPVTYTLELKKFDKFLGKKDSLINSMQSEYAVNEKKVHTGFVAQEVERAAKDLSFDFDGVNAPKNDKDNYSIVYAEFVPSLVKAVQELSAQNDALRAEIKELRQLISNGQPQAQINSNAQVSKTIVISDENTLQQNRPNPVRNTTVINYSLPQKFTKASILITDRNGKTIKQENLGAAGRGSLNIDASMLASGAYNYSLIVDGKIIASKQMVVAK